MLLRYLCIMNKIKLIVAYLMHNELERVLLRLFPCCFFMWVEGGGVGVGPTCHEMNRGAGTLVLC